MLDKLQAVVRV